MLSAAETLVLEFGGPNETTSHFNTMQTSPMELRYIMFEASTRLRLLAPGTGLYIKMVKIKYLWHIEPVFIYMCGPGGRPWPTELCFNKKLISYDILQIYFLCHFGGEGNFSHAAFRIFFHLVLALISISLIWKGEKLRSHCELELGPLILFG